MYFSNMQVNSIRCWQFQDNEYKLLKKYEFIDIERVFLQYKFENVQNKLEINLSSNLHFSIGDSDHI